MLFCTIQSRPVASGNFLIDNLNLTSRSSKGPILVEGTVTHIAYALGLIRKLSHCLPVISDKQPLVLQYHKSW